METTKRNPICHSIASGLLICSVFLFLPSCSEEEDWLSSEVNYKSLGIDGDLYYGQETFTRISGEPIMETRSLENLDFDCFDGNFILKIQNGTNKKTRVSSAEIWIDGLLIVGPSGFSKNISSITKQLSGLTSESILKVKLNGSPGSLITLWIEGTLEGPCCGDIVYDIEGNAYKTVKIGDQCWMAENLKSTKYNNGDLLGTTTPSTLDISGEINPKYQWAFNGDENNANIFGRLYTWYAVTDNRGICPTGWHVPTFTEWNTLIDYLTINGYGYEGSGEDIAKSLASTSVWTLSTIAGQVGNDQLSNNKSGFNGLPAGERRNEVTWIHGSIGQVASWWSATTENDDIRVGTWSHLESNVDIVERVWGMKYTGLSVRCVKD